MNLVRVARRAPLARFAAVALLYAGVAARLASTELPVPAPPSATTPIERDLGEGLAFFRAHELPADLPPAAVKSGPLVLDLRFTATKDSAASALDAWLKFRATPATPVFVLTNERTAVALRHVLATAKSRAGLLTLGSASLDFTPDIVLIADTEADQRAYDALERGSGIAALITENADKPRLDEAALVRERTNPPADPATFAGDTAEASPEQPAAAPVAEPVIDRPLQRAVQVHRALVALQRL